MLENQFDFLKNNCGKKKKTLCFDSHRNGSGIRKKGLQRTDGFYKYFFFYSGRDILRVTAAAESSLVKNKNKTSCSYFLGLFTCWFRTTAHYNLILVCNCAGILPHGIPSVERVTGDWPQYIKSYVYGMRYSCFFFLFCSFTFTVFLENRKTI